MVVLRVRIKVPGAHQRRGWYDGNVWLRADGVETGVVLDDVGVRRGRGDVDGGDVVGGVS